MLFVHMILMLPLITTQESIANATLFASNNLSAETPVSRSTWMADHWQHIRHRRLSEVLFPGTYASASYSLLSWRGVVAGWPWVNTAYHLGLGEMALKWLRTQQGDLYSQLNEGYRHLDLHITDCHKEFCWCHGLVGTSIRPGLQQIRNFLQEHPNEIILVGVQYVPQLLPAHCPNPDNIANERRLMDELIGQFEPHLVPVTISSDPIMDKVLGTGRRVILICSDENGCSVSKVAAKWIWYSKSNESLVILSEPTSSSFALFEKASSSMKSQRQIGGPSRLDLVMHPSIKMLGCDLLFSLPACSFLFTGAFIAICLNLAWFRIRNNRLRRRKRSVWRRVQMAVVLLFATLLLLREALNIIAPCYNEYLPHSLLQLANSSNLNGEVELNPNGYKYSSDIIHNAGINDMLHYWTSRPATYHQNIVLVNGHLSSVLPNIAISSMSGHLIRSLRLVFVGTPLEGKQGIRTLFACHPMQLSYLLASRDEGHVITWMGIMAGEQVTLREGAYPMDTYLIIFAGNSRGDWYQLYSGNLQALSDKGYDLYIRGYETRTGRGLAYITRTLEDTSDRCITPVPPGTVNYTKWDVNTLPQSRKRRTSSVTRKPR